MQNLGIIHGKYWYTVYTKITFGLHAFAHERKRTTSYIYDSDTSNKFYDSAVVISMDSFTFYALLWHDLYVLMLDDKIRFPTMSDIE